MYAAQLAEQQEQNHLWSWLCRGTKLHLAPVMQHGITRYTCAHIYIASTYVDTLQCVLLKSCLYI